MDSLLKMNIVDGPFNYVVYTIAAIAFVYVVVRRPMTLRWIVTAIIAAFVGLIASFIVRGVVSANNSFGVDLTEVMGLWIDLAFMGICIAIANLWNTRLHRKILAIVAALVIGLAGTVGISADFGIDRNLGNFLGINTEKKIKLPVADETEAPFVKPTLKAGGALWANWVPPADMPTAGTTGQVSIPNTQSGFSARAAGLYLPPAALTATPPPLPLVIMLMGQPGNPDPSFQKQALDGLAARHNGLAPIVLVVDQIGNPNQDPLCLNTPRFGNSETYVVKDAVAWARSNLFVLQDPAHWVVAGYSNGGACAIGFGAKYPEIWGNVADIAGEEFPGGDTPGVTLKNIFGGNQAAYDEVKPINILNSKKPYADSFAIFTAGSKDTFYKNNSLRLNDVALGAGWKSQFIEMPGVGHRADAIVNGMATIYPPLYPRLGLSDPSLGNG